MQLEGQNIKQTAAQYCNCASCNQAQPSVAVPQQQCTVTPQYQYQYYQYPQRSIYPQNVQNQGYSVPSSASGVNIQIFNPAVTTPGSQAPSYNVNAPTYYPPNAQNNGGCCQCPEQSGVDNSKETNTDKQETTETNKKTEKKTIVQLTDEYIKSLENGLNSQEKEIRLNAAKEVIERLEEDSSRKDDKALTALINKMLQDPSEEIKLLALTALESRNVLGDEYTKSVLTNMQNTDSGGFGLNAVDANRVLLKMSGQTVEKEVPVSETKKTKTESKETVKKE